MKKIGNSLFNNETILGVMDKKIFCIKFNFNFKYYYNIYVFFTNEKWKRNKNK